MPATEVASHTPTNSQDCIVGTSHGDFVKFPRTPHLFGSSGTADDTHLNEQQSRQFLANESLIVEEKIDGTNVGIHFSDEGRLVLQCRGHLITEGMHPQYDLFKQWASAKQHLFAELLQNRFIMYGEWLYATHTIHYTKLPHYFLEIDIYDKHELLFLSRNRRAKILTGSTIHSMPVVYSGPIKNKKLEELITTSTFSDQLMEGLYFRSEADGVVTGRAKFVRQEFVEKMNENVRWRHKLMVPNVLAEGADVWS